MALVVTKVGLVSRIVTDDEWVADDDVGVVMTSCPRLLLRLRTCEMPRCSPIMRIWDLGLGELCNLRACERPRCPERPVRKSTPSNEDVKDGVRWLDGSDD